MNLCPHTAACTQAVAPKDRKTTGKLEGNAVTQESGPREPIHPRAEHAPCPPTCSTSQCLTHLYCTFVFGSKKDAPQQETMPHELLLLLLLALDMYGEAQALPAEQNLPYCIHYTQGQASEPMCFLKKTELT